TYDDLEQLGFGSWLKDNAGNLIQGAAGAGMMFIPGMQVAGAGMLAGSASGFANTAIQKNKQEATEKAMQNQQALTAQRNRNSVAEAPISFVPTMKCGGRLKRMANGGDIKSQNLYMKNFNDLDRFLWDNYIKNPDIAKETKSDMVNTQVDLMEDIPSSTDKIYDKKNMNEINYLNNLYDRLQPHINTENVDTFISDNSNPINLIKKAQLVRKLPIYKNDLDSLQKYIPDYYNNYELGKLKPILKEMADGGTINYNGQLHTGPDGGVPVDGMGNPNPMNPVALVEKGEVSYNDGETPYVFSDKLEQDKKKTFAKRAKEIQKKYKMRMVDGRIIDPIAKAGYDKEMQSLIEAQETKRRELGLTQDAVPQAANGGGLPKYFGPNITNDYSQYLPNLELPSNVNMPQIVQNAALQDNYFNPDFRFGQEPVNNYRPLSFG
ncbi:MAG TPA: hypothetical protein PLG47_06080, partial [Candidatus Dojkabacteria bacterium]|nr:hypothetical protein [Candidatus Dojkabacteria bacterium]